MGWYLEHVLPKEFGVQLPPWFLCDPSYWTGKPRGADSFGARIDIEALARDDAVEEASSSLQSCIEIRNLRKVFQTPAGPKVAVDSLSLDLGW